MGGAHPVDRVLLGTLFILIKHVLQNELLLGFCACSRAGPAERAHAPLCRVALALWTTRRRRVWAPHPGSFFLAECFSSVCPPLPSQEGLRGCLAVSAGCPLLAEPRMAGWATPQLDGCP